MAVQCQLTALHAPDTPSTGLARVLTVRHPPPMGHKSPSPWGTGHTHLKPFTKNSAKNWYSSVPIFSSGCLNNTKQNTSGICCSSTGMFVPPGVLKVQAAVLFPRASPGGRRTIALPVCLSQQVGDWHVFILRGTGPCFCKKHLMIFALDFKKSFNTAKGSLAFAHVALPGMGSRCPGGQGPSNTPAAGSEVTLVPAQSSTVPVANGAHGSGSVPETPLPQLQPRFPTFPCGCFRAVGTRKGQGLQSPP